MFRQERVMEAANVIQSKQGSKNRSSIFDRLTREDTAILHHISLFGILSFFVAAEPAQAFLIL